MVTEVCVNSYQSAVYAQNGGASRIELCAELGVGGITPSYGLIKKVKETLDIPVHVLIRPRSGHFCYSKAELEIMLTNIAFCKEIGCEGIVVGALKEDLTIDLEKMALLKEASGKMHLTFHRAFDWLLDPEEGLKQLETLGCNTVLTSGQAPSVADGLSNLVALNQLAEEIVVMPGGGIKASIIPVLKKYGFGAVHFSATRMVEGLRKNPGISFISENLLGDSFLSVSDEDTIREIVNLAAK